MCSFAVNDEGAWRKKPGSAPRGVRQAECEGCGWTKGRGGAWFAGKKRTACLGIVWAFQFDYLVAFALPLAHTNGGPLNATPIRSDSFPSTPLPLSSLFPHLPNFPQHNKNI